MDEEPKKTSVFQANLVALIGSGSVNAWAKQHGLEQTTVQRIVSGVTDPKLSMIERVAKALKVEPWQLMVPGFKLEEQSDLAELQAKTVAVELRAQMESVLAELREIKTQNARPPAPPELRQEGRPRRMAK